MRRLAFVHGRIINKKRQLYGPAASLVESDARLNASMHLASCASGGMESEPKKVQISVRDEEVVGRSDGL